MTDAVTPATQQGVVSTQIEQVQQTTLPPAAVIPETQQQSEQAPPPPPPPESGRGANLDTSA